MHVLEMLLDEHRHIERVLQELERACERARAGDSPPLQRFSQLVNFLLLHAEGSHHEKEHALFALMALQRLPVGGALLPAIAGEHTLGRELAEDLRTALDGWGAGREQEPLLAAAGRYVRHARAHARDEEQRVFPLAQRLLPSHLLEPVRARYACTELAHGRLTDAARALLSSP